MWVVTVFNNQNDIRIFEYMSKNEAIKALQAYKAKAILSYTN